MLGFLRRLEMTHGTVEELLIEGKSVLCGMFSDRELPDTISLYLLPYTLEQVGRENLRVFVFLIFQKDHPLTPDKGTRTKEQSDTQHCSLPKL